MSDSMSLDETVEQAIRRISQITSDLAGLTRVADNGMNAVRGARVYDPASRAYNNALQSGAYNNGADHVVLEQRYAEAVGTNLVASVRRVRGAEGTNTGLFPRPGKNQPE